MRSLVAIKCGLMYQNEVIPREVYGCITLMKDPQWNTNLQSKTLFILPYKPDNLMICFPKVMTLEGLW